MTNALIHCDQIRVPFVSVGRAQQSTLTQRFELGQRWAVIGRNGAGKSQLLACLAGLQQVASGSIAWQQLGQARAQDANSISNWSELVSYQPAVMDESFSETLAERLEIMHSHFLGLANDRKTKDHQAQLLKIFNLNHLLNRPVQSLSSGEQQRTWLIQRLLQPAPIVLLDEPLAHQDLAYQNDFGLWLEANERQANERLVIMCLHQLDWAARFCTHVLAIDANGQFIAGKIAQVLNPDLLESIFQIPFKSIESGSAFPVWTKPSLT
jgi:iron complex transport system ATP-binding protein